MSDRPSGEQHLYDWPTSIAFAVGGTAAAVVLIVVFTYLVDWVGSFWSQVVYFLAVFGGVVGLALRSRMKDDVDPARLRAASSPVTPMGLPGPFVLTQALGVLGIAMIAVGLVVQGDRGILWTFAGFVLVLVGGVGLVTWLLAMAGRRRAGARGRSAQPARSSTATAGVPSSTAPSTTTGRCPRGSSTRARTSLRRPSARSRRRRAMSASSSMTSAPSATTPQLGQRRCATT